jgi:hypothetical protein
MNGLQSAFPLSECPYPGNNGLTKKEAVAIAALQGLLACQIAPRMQVEDLIVAAWNMAGKACEQWEEDK